MPETLYLIDGHALAYRMYYALNSVGGDRFTTQSGEGTAGTYGFINALMRLLEKDRPEYLAVAFDVGKTFRDDIFPDYKATREKMPDDLRAQIERIRELVDAFHFPRLEVEGYEADDVLGSTAFHAVEMGLGVKIITGDRDLLQLVKDRVIVNLPSSKSSDTVDYDAAGVMEYMGIRPDQVVDYKALAGDSSDNIPGVPGVGDKTAKTLLAEYDHLDAIYDHLDDIPTRFRNKLIAGKESAYLSYDLARIRTDVKITLDLEVATTTNIDFEKVETLFKELEFRSLISRLHNLPRKLGVVEDAPGAFGLIGTQQLSLFGEPAETRIGVPPSGDTEVIIVDNEQALNAMLKEIGQADEIAFDTETTGTDPMRAKLVGISLAVKSGSAYYIPVGHHSQNAQLPLKTVIDALRPAFTDLDIRKIGHNIKYDALMLLRNGLEINPISFDTMIAEWVLNPSSRRLGLKDLADEILGIEMTHIEALIGSGKNQITMAEVAVESAAPYAAADADMTLRLKQFFDEKIKEAGADELFQTLEMPLIPVLIDMEMEGILLDTPFLNEMEGELETRQNEIERSIYRTVGFEFNINSTQQLSDVLFETLALTPPPRTKKTSSGKYSTAASVLEEMAGKHPVVDWILEYRELSKLNSTYVKSLPQEVNPNTKRVHSSFGQTGTVTGRLSSSNPNLQNIPTRTELGQRVRKAFIASPGHSLIAVDYSQIELRIVAHMSKDEAMLNAFRAGQDIHAATAAAIYGVSLDLVSKEMRRHAKAINFGLIYGMSSFGLSSSTGLTMGEAETFVNLYFKQFPNVKKYLDRIRFEAAQNGYVETLFGRRRYFPNLRDERNTNQRRREEREAINAPIQGTAADIMKLAMIKLGEALKTAPYDAKLLLQIHDELMLECPDHQIKETVQLVQEVMENTYQLSIPLLTEAKVGKNWAEMEQWS
ncbi:MAG: DNA polymerase I [Anaerolineaceae bacterium]|nr:DNA polymerase I [Anaerolineaceae bacterium]